MYDRYLLLDLERYLWDSLCLMFSAMAVKATSRQIYDIDSMIHG